MTKLGSIVRSYPLSGLVVAGGVRTTSNKGLNDPLPGCLAGLAVCPVAGVQLTDPLPRCPARAGLLLQQPCCCCHILPMAGWAGRGRQFKTGRGLPAGRRCCATCVQLPDFE
jgi:hypothetical protein